MNPLVNGTIRVNPRLMHEAAHRYALKDVGRAGTYFAEVAETTGREPTAADADGLAQWPTAQQCYLEFCAAIVTNEVAA